MYEVVFSFPEVIKFPIHLPARKSPSIPSGNLMMSANPLEFGGIFLTLFLLSLQVSDRDRSGALCSGRGKQELIICSVLVLDFLLLPGIRLGK